MTASPRIAITLVFMAFGVISGLWSGSVPTVARRVGLDAYQLGFAFTVLLIASVSAQTLAGRLARRMSSRQVLLVTVPAMAVFGIGILASSSVATFFTALVGYGVAQGMTDVFMNAEGSAIEAEMGRRIFTGLHGGVSASGALFAIVGSLLATAFGPVSAAPIVIVAGAAATWAVARAIRHRSIAPRRPAAATAIGAWVAWPLVALGLAIGFENAGEMAALMWSARLLDEAAPSLAAIAGLGPAFYSACSALVRLNGDRLRSIFGDGRLVAGSLLVATAGFIGVGVFSGFAARVIAFAVVGFGTACVIPCMFAIAANSDPEARARRLGFVAMVAGPPRVLTPILFGSVAQTASMGMAFGLCGALMLVALGMFVISQTIARPVVAASAS